MSRVGLKTIVLPDKVEVSVGETSLTFKGPKGSHATPLPKGIAAKVDGRNLKFERASDSGPVRALHGLARALAANAVTGVTSGFEKRLEIVGVGFRAAVQGRKVVFNIGYSHPVEFSMPQGIDIAIEEQTKVVVRGIDRQAVGQVAAQIRGLRPPDAYKGKGIRHAGEVIRLKPGKAGSK
jgi:large subunit ribosomal protein L6